MDILYIGIKYFKYKNVEESTALPFDSSDWQKGNQECMGANVLPKVMIVILNDLGFSGVSDTFPIVLNIFRLFPGSLGSFYLVEFFTGLNGMYRRTICV